MNATEYTKIWLTNPLKSASGLGLDTDFVFEQGNDHNYGAKMMMKCLHDWGISV